MINQLEQDCAQEVERYNHLYDQLITDGQLLFVGRLLQRSAKRVPERVALIFKNHSMTYKELYRRASVFSRVLKKAGVNVRDRVLICFENCPEFYISYFAAWQLGAVVAPLNTFLQAHEIKHIVEDAQPTVIVTSQERKIFFTSEQSTIILLTPDDMISDDIVSEAIDDEQIVDLLPDEMAALLYTSGTTGVPKGVMLSSKNIMTNLVQGLARLNVTDNQRVFAVLPLFHVLAQNCCLWGPIFVGCTIILVAKIDRRLILDGLRHKPTFFLGVPALFGLLCLMKNAPIDTIDFFASGGDALPDKIRLVFALLYRRKLCTGYGMTETTPVIAVDLYDHVGPASCVGRLVVGISAQIRDETGAVCAINTIGTLWVKGENIMLGYYKAPEITASVMQDGWLNTGDLGYFDQLGTLYITGRIKDIIKNKGLMIYPQEIENVIMTDQNVIGAGIVGRKDEYVGEVPVAFVQLRIDDVHAPNRLKKLCEQYLALYKVPKEFICTTKELPKMPTGKLDKKALRKMLIEQKE